MKGTARKIRGTAKHRLYAVVFALLCAAIQARAELPHNAVWIDVRSHAEYERGHLAESVLIPFDGIEAGVARLRLSRNTPIYLYCAVGGRAEVAKKRLEALDYTDVTNVGSLEAARGLAAAQTP